MRLTLQLDEQLLSAVNKLAADTGRTVSQIVEDALRRALAEATSRSVTNFSKLHTFGGHGLQAGVDLTSNAKLEDFINKHDQ